jgi:hypothetical protein
VRIDRQEILARVEAVEDDCTVLAGGLAADHVRVLGLGLVCVEKHYMQAAGRSTFAVDDARRDLARRMHDQRDVCAVVRSVQRDGSGHPRGEFRPRVGSERVLARRNVIEGEVAVPVCRGADPARGQVHPDGRAGNAFEPLRRTDLLEVQTGDPALHSTGARWQLRLGVSLGESVDGRACADAAVLDGTEDEIPPPGRELHAARRPGLRVGTGTRSRR